jgi:serine-type D-Ala-D-Ala carboxypeptidase
MDLEYTPGTRTVYSDFGMILLALAIERITGTPLDLFLKERVFDPLRMRDTGFNPLGLAPDEGLLAATSGGSDEEPVPVLQRIAPTERDTVFRHTHVHGVVHDENAYAIGGVAGHAGLFSSVRDLAVFAQLMLNGGSYGDQELLQPATVRRFTTRHSQRGLRSSRALGWANPSGAS